MYCFKPESSISNINQAVLFRLPKLRCLALEWNITGAPNQKSILLKRYQNPHTKGCRILQCYSGTDRSATELFEHPQPDSDSCPLKAQLPRGRQQFWVSSSPEPSPKRECSEAARRLPCHRNTCLHRLWDHLAAETRGPAAFVYLRSTFKNCFLATGFTKARGILVVLSRRCKVKTKIVAPLYSVKSLCERFNKTIYSSHLVPIWRSSQKLRKKK